MSQGILEVRKPTGTETFAWNGDPADRQAARSAFESLMRTGQYMASVSISKGRSEQVRTFAEVEAIEKERDYVEAVISPALVGG